MTDKEPTSIPTPRHEKFNYFLGPDGETYRIPKPEFAAEIAHDGLLRMAVVAEHTRNAMARSAVE